MNILLNENSSVKSPGMVSNPSWAAVDILVQVRGGECTSLDNRNSTQFSSSSIRLYMGGGATIKYFYITCPDESLDKKRLRVEFLFISK